MAVIVNQSNFEKELLQSDQPVLIDFYADWCMPCKMLSPVIEEIANEKKDIKVCKINIDQEQELAQQFRIMSIPTLVVMKDGKVINSVMGVRPKEEILAMLAS